MKQVSLFRHAKSSWKYEITDMFRPLNRRGYRDAALMATTTGCFVPDLICCSPAVRTYSTALYYLKQLAIPMDKLHLDWALYEASGQRLFDYLKTLHEGHQHIWLFGHNPGLNELVDISTGKEIDNIVTGAIVTLRWQTERWNKLSPKQAVLGDIKIPPKQPE
ncbi:histidine phosphatase family protein [Bowmanella sp. Y26]|uniref:SixA phosphatase family protein n=1 Tax=Bowmanella yangjiangensis TaxID=2811230 RepID=UPI001BDC51DA|nr:histidine phosphatase family protein [Bowmanella yangjiangensis]MBT1063597.1 histidine phosphatase family protein [Bowmanella yangjiangensis]